MNLDQPQIIPEPEKVEEPKKSLNVFVEELIPDIKPPLGPMEGMEYSSNIFDTSFVETFWECVMPQIVLDKESKDFAILKERMRDEVVVDLGAGFDRKGYILACLLGAKGYVGVDLNTPRRGYASTRVGITGNMNENEFRQEMVKSLVGQRNIGRETTEEYNAELERTGKVLDYSLIRPVLIPTSAVKEDMLDFLRRLPDDSVSIFMFGIDTNIIEGRKYIQELNQEIERVLSRNGGLINAGSTTINETRLKNLVTKEERGTSRLGPIWDDKLGNVLIKE